MTSISTPENHVSTYYAAKLLGRAEETLRGWRHRKANLVELPFHRGENGRITYALSDIQNFIREQTGEQVTDESEVQAIVSDAHDLSAELVRIRRRKRIRTASNLLRRVVEILGTDEIEMDAPADLAQLTGSVAYAEFFATNITGCRDLLLSASVWLADWSDPPEPALTETK